MESKNKKFVFIAVVIILSLFMIIVGVTVAFFNYMKTGSTENLITTGNITFYYDEVDKIGNGINITDALPMSDSDGKAQEKGFNFRIVSNTISDVSIPYTITLRRKTGTDNLGDVVKVYLAKTNGYNDSVSNEVEVVTSLYDALTTVTNNNFIEKKLYEDVVPTDTTNYNQYYRFKMWIDETADIDDNQHMDKTFTVMVNVYANGEHNEAINLNDLLLHDNTLITDEPTLDHSSNLTTDRSGLYKMSVTDGFGGQDGDTYYFRGNVTTNKVKFAGLDWRVVRINEDGTVRLVLDDLADNTKYKLDNNYRSQYMYYSNDNLKNIVDTWYDTNIGSDSEYSSKVATGDYFCQAAKTLFSSSYTGENARMTLYSSYIPDLKCVTDGNGYGLVSGPVGLMNYDEFVLAGNYWSDINNEYYLYKSANYWTMSPAGYNNGIASIWTIRSGDFLGSLSPVSTAYFRPVINLKADTKATYNATTGYYEV